MPELPEIETIRCALEPLITHQTIREISVFERRLRVPLASDFAARLRGARITKLKRRGKYLLVELDNATLLIHCGMSGSLIYRKGKDRPAKRKHDHVLFMLDDGFLAYHDPRRFGFMSLGMTHLPALGIEPFDLTPAHLYDLTQKMTSSVKNLLMNQRYIAGLGNIYALESLHRAGLHPEESCHHLTLQDCTHLTSAITATLKDALASGGSSLRDYRNGVGGIGYFQHQFKVYGRNHQKCPACETEIKAIKQNGRTSFFCPYCQKLKA